MSYTHLLTTLKYARLAGGFCLCAYALDAQRQQIGALYVQGKGPSELAPIRAKAVAYAFAIGSIAAFPLSHLSTLLSGLSYLKVSEAQFYEKRSWSASAWQAFYLFGTAACISAALLPHAGAALAVAAGVAKSAAYMLYYMEGALFVHTMGGLTFSYLMPPQSIKS